MTLGLRMLRAAKIVRMLQAPTEERRPTKWSIFYEAPIKELIAALWIATERPDETELTRIILAELLGKRRVKSAVPVLLHCLQDPSNEVRHQAMQALGRIGDPEVGSYLWEHLNFAEAPIWMRFELAAVYGETRFKPAIPLLIDLLLDEDKELRMVAAGSLRLLQAEEAIEPLTNAIAIEPDSSVRRAMTDSLEKIRTRATATYSAWQWEQLVAWQTPRNASGSLQRPHVIRWRLYD